MLKSSESGLELRATSSSPHRGVRWRAIARIVVISILVSEIITIALTRILFGEVLEEGMLIALVCAGPISAWIALREFRMRDLIEHQRDQLSEFNTELRRRNFDLDAFSRAVAHDLRNPLTVVIGMAEILAADPDLMKDDETNSAVESVLQAGQTANATIEGLLLLHGINQDNVEARPLDTDATVARALESLHPLIAERDAVISHPGTLPDVVGHGPWVEQVWANLIGNAVKYGGSPPRVELAARSLPGGFARFEVRDSGPGIPETDRHRIFREFERGTSDVEGHGLGLAIVKRVVDRLGGKTGVESRPGGGSIFYFDLPAAPTRVIRAPVGASIT